MCGWFMNIICININGNCVSQLSGAAYQEQSPVSPDFPNNSNKCQLWIDQTTDYSTSWVGQIKNNKKLNELHTTKKLRPSIFIFYFLR